MRSTTENLPSVSDRTPDWPAAVRIWGRLVVVSGSCAFTGSPNLSAKIDTTGKRCRDNDCDDQLLRFRRHWITSSLWFLRWPLFSASMRHHRQLGFNDSDSFNDMLMSIFVVIQMLPKCRPVPLGLTTK